MTDNHTKVIKSTLNRLLAARVHGKHQQLNKLLEGDFDYDLCITWIEKFNQNNLLMCKFSMGSTQIMNKPF